MVASGHTQGTVDDCLTNAGTNPEFLPSIACQQDFQALENGLAKENGLGTVSSVKVTYDLKTGKIYYINTSSFDTHFAFCLTYLDYPNDHSMFNFIEYGSGRKRRYCNVVINYYPVRDIYAYEYFSDDWVPEYLFRITDQKLRETFYLGQELQFLPTGARTRRLSKSLGLEVVLEEDLMPGNRFQGLNPGISYGYLNKLTQQELNANKAGKRDIIVLEGSALNIPLVAGVITTGYQPPLSHINVLSRNRGTPNMSLNTAWEDSLITALNGRLVRLTVERQDYSIRSASVAEAEKFWAKNRREVTRLQKDDSTQGLPEILELRAKDAIRVGSKAANFAELQHVVLPGNHRINLPEHAFAIPFFYYRQHLEKHGIDHMIDSLLSDSIARENVAELEKQLQLIRQKIIDSPLDEELDHAVEARIRDLGGAEKRIRFRSSSNAEDLPFFNGAGLYTSKSAHPGDSVKTNARAIKRVWASLWKKRAYQEREYYNIDHRTVAMGVLVHRSFPNEIANGVGVSANIRAPKRAGVYVNVQPGDVSVVRPEENWQSDEITVQIKDPWDKESWKIRYLAYSDLADQAIMNNEEVLALSECLKAIEKHFRDPKNYPKARSDLVIEIEFKLDSPNRKLYIKQARPFPIISN